jgi:putative FmdB family regulatory protein
MPIYEYQCQQCGHQLEALQKISDPPLSDCPQCQQQALHKLVSAASFRLKGGGWYETDFKSGNKKHLADSGDGSGTSGATAGAEGGAGGEGGKSAGKDSKDTGKSDKSASGESKGSGSEKKAKPAASGDGKKSPASST